MTDANILRSNNVESADISILDNGILHVHIKIEDEFRIENSKEIVEAREKLAEGQPYPLLYTANQYVIPSKEVREYLATETRSELVLADAFVINSLPQRILARTFIRFNNPVRPTKVFEQTDEAIAWLLQFVQPSMS